MTQVEQNIATLRGKLRSLPPYSKTWHQLNDECAAFVRQWRQTNTLRSIE